MTPAELSVAVVAAVSACIDAGEFAGVAPADAVIERPKNPEHGDYATNIALRLAKAAGKPAREVAQAIATRLADAEGIAAVEVAGPGADQKDRAKVQKLSAAWTGRLPFPGYSDFVRQAVKRIHRPSASIL